jgi:hypothetical protein
MKNIFHHDGPEGLANQYVKLRALRVLRGKTSLAIKQGEFTDG